MITIKIKTGSSAFEEVPFIELARILKVMAKDCENIGELKSKYADVNGNNVVTVETN